MEINIKDKHNVMKISIEKRDIKNFSKECLEDLHYNSKYFAISFFKFEEEDTKVEIK